MHEFVRWRIKAKNGAALIHLFGDEIFERGHFNGLVRNLVRQVSRDYHDTFTITVEEGVEGDRHLCGTTHAGLADDVAPGERILVDDGRVCLEVTSVDGPRVRTRVIEGGVVFDHKGLNLPGVAVSVPALTKKDEDDLRWALRTGFDVIALSFVRSGRDVLEVHRVMDDEGRRLPVIAKIEKPQAVEALEDIVSAFDGIMIARGDLGVEMPLEQVPIVQKRAIKLARRNAKVALASELARAACMDASGGMPNSGSIHASAAMITRPPPMPSSPASTPATRPSSGNNR